MNILSKYLFRVWAFVLIALLATWMVYVPALSGPFLLDDHSNVLPLAVPAQDIENFESMLFGNTSGIWGRPVSIASFIANYYFGAETSFPFKLTNLIIHLLNGILVFLILSLLRRVVYSKEGNSDGQASLLAGICTLIWLIHPLHISTVMYVVQRMTLLSTFFSLSSLLLYALARTRVFEKGSANALILLSCLATFLLSCLSKESGVLTIVYIFLMEIIVLSRVPLPGVSISSYHKTLILIALMGSIIGFGYFVMNYESLMAAYVQYPYGVYERLLTQLTVVKMYLEMMIIPSIDTMSLYHDGYKAIYHIDSHVIVSFIILLLLFVSSLISLKKAPLYSFGILLFFASHVIESTVLPLELAFEHRTYIGSIGIAIALFSILRICLLRIFSPNFHKISIALLIVISGLGFLTFSRATEWGSELSHNTIAYQNKPDSERAVLEIAKTYARIGKVSEGVFVLDEAYQKEYLDNLHIALTILIVKGVNDNITNSDIEKVLHSGKQYDFGYNSLRMLSSLQSKKYRGFLTSLSHKDLYQIFETIDNNGLERLKPFEVALFYSSYAEEAHVLGHTGFAIGLLDKAMIAMPENINVRLRAAELQIMAGEKDTAASTLIEIAKSDISLNQYQLNKIGKLSELIQ